MSEPIPVLVPPLHPNEPESRLTAIHAPEGTRVVSGQLLVSLETTKSSVEVTAEAAGFVAGGGAAGGGGARAAGGRWGGGALRGGNCGAPAIDCAGWRRNSTGNRRRLRVRRRSRRCRKGCA